MTWEYISGYFDGEGTIGIAFMKRKERKIVNTIGWNICPIISISSFDYGVLEDIKIFCQKYFRCNCKFNGRYIRKGQSQKAKRFYITGWNNVENFMKKIYPHIIGKKPQFDKLKELIVVRKQWQKLAPKHFNHMPIWNKEWFLKHVKIIDELNNFKTRKRGKYNFDFFTRNLPNNWRTTK